MKIFFLFLLIVTPLFSQYQNVTKQAREEMIFAPLASEGIGKAMAQTNVIGASLDNNQTLHITLDAIRTVTMPIDLFAPLFRSARNLFRRFARAEEIKVYYAVFVTQRDEYGYETKEEKKIVAMFSLTREKSNKLNWNRIEELLDSYTLDKELVSYVDGYWMDKNYYRNDAK